MYKMVAFDIDGTLVPHLTHVFSNKIEDMFQKLKEKGFIITLATGRDWISIADLYKNKYVDYYIGANGSFIYDLKNNKYIFNSCIKWEEFEKLNEEILENNIDDLNGIILSDVNNVYVKEINRKENWFWEKFRHKFKKYDLSFTELDRNNFHLITIEQKRHTDLLNKINNFLNKNNFTLAVQSWWPTGIFLANKGVNKSSSIKKLCKYLNIDMKQVIAFGDGENDIEMIKDAGLGVAMGNSVDKLKDVANDVTIEVEEHGTKFYLKKIGII